MELALVLFTGSLPRKLRAYFSSEPTVPCRFEALGTSGLIPTSPHDLRQEIVPDFRVIKESLESVPLEVSLLCAS
jgi:hypothetical protein